MITGVKCDPNRGRFSIIFDVVFDDDVLKAMQEIHEWIDRNGPHRRPFMFQVRMQFDIESYRVRGRIDAESWPWESWFRPQPSDISLVTWII